MPYFAETSLRVCLRDERVIQLHNKSVLKGHVVVHRSSQRYVGHIAGISIEFAIERRFNARYRFQSNELYHLATISANYLSKGFSA